VTVKVEQGETRSCSAWGDDRRARQPGARDAVIRPGLGSVSLQDRTQDSSNTDWSRHATRPPAGTVPVCGSAVQLAENAPLSGIVPITNVIGASRGKPGSSRKAGWCGVSELVEHGEEAGNGIPLVASTVTPTSANGAGDGARAFPQPVIAWPRLLRTTIQPGARARSATVSEKRGQRGPRSGGGCTASGPV